MVRGENVLLLGEIVSHDGGLRNEYVTHTCTRQDLDKDDDVPASFQPGPVEEVFELHKEEQAQKKKQDKTKQKRLQALGFLGDSIGEGVF